MSKVALSGNASGSGTFTIASPNSNTDRTLTLPDATGTVQVSGNPISGTTGTFSGDLTLGSSTLATPTGSAPSYLCRAWVNFNGTGTVAIRASGNVSSITDNGTGDYTVNFTTAMPDVNYSVTLTSDVKASSIVPNASGGFLAALSRDALPTTAGFRMETFTTGARADSWQVNASIFR